MRIRYENTMEDLLAFNEYHLTASPHMRRSIRLNTWTLPAVALCAAVALTIVRGSVAWLVWGALFGLLYVPIYRRLSRRTLRRSILALLQEGKNDAVLCEHELEVTPDALVERTPVSEAQTSWSAIGRVESAEGYAFVYTQANAAHIVPRDRLIEGDGDGFFAAVCERAGAGTDE